MLENAIEVWRILNEEKGMLYVCGDARAMAKDVYQTLLQIVSTQGSRNEELAAQYISMLRETHRYVEDVWG